MKKSTSTQSGKNTRSLRADMLYREIELKLLEKSKEELNNFIGLMDQLYALRALNDAYNNGK